MNDRTENTRRTIVSRIERLLGERSAPLLVAIDGQSGAGKSRLAAAIAAEVEAVVVDGDDFYAGGSDAEWDTRTVREKVDQCIDRRRLRSEALEPLLAGRAASWHPFDWEAGQGLAARPIVGRPARVILLDGAYSARPELADLLGLSVMVDVPAEVRRQRLLEREGADAIDAWYRRWDEAEVYYFTRIRPRASFDIVVAG